MSRKTVLIGAIALLIIGCASRQAPITKAPTKGANPVMTETEMSMSEPFYKSYTLENGLQVYLIPKRDIPVATVLIAVRNGAFAETPDNNGLAHLYEHMFFKANEQIPSQPAFFEALSEMGIELGPNMNAYTSTESVRYFFTIQSQYIERGIHFMADALRTPKFLQAELEKERKVVIGEFDRYEADPTRVFFQHDMMKKLFYEHFTRKNTIGIREVILSASREQMFDIKNRYYVPNNTALFITGDFTEDQVRTTITEAFGTWESSDNPFEKYPVPEHPPLLKKETFIKTAPVNNVRVIQGFHGPKMGLQNRELIAFDLISIMLSLESNKFQKELVDSGLTTGAAAYMWDQRYTSPVMMSLETSPDKAQVAYNKFRDLVHEMAKGEFFTEKELETAKTSIEVSSAYDREVGQSLSLALASYWTSTGSLDYYLQYIPTMQTITMDEINQALDKYMSDQNYVLGVLMPENSTPIEF